MSGEQNKEKVNKLIGNEGSISDRARIATELDDDELQLASPYSRQAEEELKRRRHKSLMTTTISEVSDGKELEQVFKILYSRGQAKHDFEQWLATALEAPYNIAILFLDIDNFKGLNTTYTETKVDETILPEVQHLIRRLTSYRGEAYRYGGEEFIVILPNHNEKEAMMFAERMRAEFEAYSFSVDEKKEALTISVGVALWPSHGADFDSLLSTANQAEHRAKEGGRNRVKLSNPSEVRIEKVDALYKCPNEPLHELAECQRLNLSSAVVIEIRRLENGEISQNARYIDFTFILYNKSVHYVDLQDSIQGHLQLCECPLGGPKEMLSKNTNPFPPTLQQYFKIRQWLTQDDERRISNSINPNEDKFDFDKLRFVVRTGNDDPQVISIYGWITIDGKLIL